MRFPSASRSAFALGALASPLACAQIIGADFDDKTVGDAPEGGDEGGADGGGDARDAAAEPAKDSPPACSDAATADAGAGCCCATPTPWPEVRDVGAPKETTIAGVLADSAFEAWYELAVRDMPESGTDSYHVRVELAKNPGDALALVVLRGGSCAELAATPAVASYDFCVDWKGPKGGLAPCGPIDGTSHCADLSATYRIGVRRRSPACAAAAFEVHVAAAAGPCVGPFGCGACSGTDALCLGGNHFRCDGALLRDDPCPDAPPNECQVPACAQASGACTYVPKPKGTVTEKNQVAGNCKKAVCDGAGNIADDPDPADLPDDKNECTKDGCNGAAPTFTPVKAGTPCGSSGGVCTPGGACGCKPGTKTCSGNTLLTCSGTGEWGSGVNCPNGCANGACK